MIKIATIEDEENIRQEIVRYIKKGIGSIEGVEVDVYESAERYLLVGGRYDLVISDIELPGISGLELGKRIKENNPDVYLVFLTSHSEFASESYIIEAYQYILKKDIEERLSPLIERVVHEIKKDYEEYRWVGTNQRKIKIYHKDIVCIQKIKGSKYAEYITENGKYMERLSMNQILEQIHSNAFILVDRGHAVNVNHIVRVRGNVIQMDNGEEITVSRVQSSQVKEKITAYWRACCGIIVITGALLCAVLFKYQLWLDEMANGSKPIRGINASMNLSAISLLIVLSGMFIIKYQVVKQEKTTLILRDQLLEERYAEMLKSRQMIHDMKNHLLVLRNMERANQWDKLHDYLEEISKDILDDSTKIWTGNNIVDLILNSKKKQADSEGIAFSIGSNMIGDVPFKDGETISLLGNLLDNAIEACERIKSTEKWVTIRINRRYCLLYIEIENSIEEHPKEKNHRLISCKSEKEVHGYGLKNVRQIVDRYDGTYSYQIKENSFLTCVSFFSNEDVS